MEKLLENLITAYWDVVTVKMVVCQLRCVCVCVCECVCVCVCARMLSFGTE